MLIVKQALGKRFRKLCFADACRSEEHKAADGSVRVGYSGTRTLNCFAYKAHSFILTDNALMERVLKMQQFFAFAFNKPRNGDSRPSRNNVCNFLVCDGGADKHILVLSFI